MPQDPKAGESSGGDGPGQTPTSANPPVLTPSAGPPPKNKTENSSTKERFTYGLLCLGAVIGLASFLQSVIGWLAALLVAAVTIIALYVIVSVVPALQARVVRIRMNINNDRRWRVAAVGTAAVLVVSAGLLVWDFSLPSPRITGSITYPRNGATVHEGYFPVSGTVQNLPPGYRLLLFLQWTNDNKFLGGNPNIVVKNGRWSGPKLLDVGRVHPFIAWLVAQGPKTINFMNGPVGEYRWGTPGFPSLSIASDSFVLNHIVLNVS